MARDNVRFAMAAVGLIAVAVITVEELVLHVMAPVSAQVAPDKEARMWLDMNNALYIDKKTMSNLSIHLTPLNEKLQKEVVSPLFDFVQFLLVRYWSSASQNIIVLTNYQ